MYMQPMQLCHGTGRLSRCRHDTEMIRSIVVQQQYYHSLYAVRLAGGCSGSGRQSPLALAAGVQNVTVEMPHLFEFGAS